MGMIKPKKYLDINVYEKALERIRYLYSLYDDVTVSFSGGKDSTALLLCVIDVARELGRLPVRAVFYDEEAIHPPTIEYVARVAERPDVNLEWYCLQVKPSPSAGRPHSPRTPATIHFWKRLCGLKVKGWVPTFGSRAGRRSA